MPTLTNKYLYFSLAIVLLYVSPWIILGEDSYVLIHDNLDSNLIWFKVLAESGAMFADNSHTISSIMNAPRASFDNELNFILWLYYMFDPYTAYVVNQILIRVVAFTGMYLLLDRYVLKEDEQQYSVLLALLYSILPFWPSGGLSIAGLPLITYALLNIRHGIDINKDWLVVLLFPFYSSFILSMMFYIVLSGIVWVHDVIKGKGTVRLTMALFLLLVLYVIINYRLIEVFIFGSDFVSHRVERVTEHYGLMNAFISSAKHFLFGQYHAHSLHIVFLPFIGILFAINLFSKKKDKVFLWLFILQVVLSLWYGFWKYEGWESIKSSISLLNTLNLSRFHFLTPLLWYVLFALSIKYYLTYFNNKYKEYIVYSIIAVSIVLLFIKSDFINEYRKSTITYKKFYAKKLFGDINRHISKNKSDYKVVSLGIHPAIAQYNGFYTVDGYLPNYTLTYKHEFRNIIDKELDKSNFLKRVFDNWGNRCYVFINDVGYNYIRKKNEVYNIDIDIDAKALYHMGVRYVFSSYKIVNPLENDLKFLKVFKDIHSAWDIYVYKVMQYK